MDEQVSGEKRHTDNISCLTEPRSMGTTKSAWKEGNLSGYWLHGTKPKPSEVLCVDQPSNVRVCRAAPLCHARDKIRNTYGGSSRTNLQELAGLQQDKFPWHVHMILCVLLCLWHRLNPPVAPSPALRWSTQKPFLLL